MPIQTDRPGVTLKADARNSRYRNPPGSPGRNLRLGEVMRVSYELLTRKRLPAIPDGHVLTRADVHRQLAAASNSSITWLGHAAFIIRIGGKTILTDPYLSKVAGPLGLGPSRYVPAPLKPSELPRADVLIVSHNHYDHLDDATIRNYPYKDTTQVVVPTGLASFFTARGYPKVVETDWWTTWTSDDLKITTLPAVHFSGRGLFDRGRTLWASFAIKAKDETVWFSGDTASGDIFKEIGEHLGPIDLALVGIGAYEPQSMMKSVHATPEEAIQIARAVRSKRAVGMHWGTIMLTPEDPFEAPVRFRQAAIDQNYGAENAWILSVGETRSIA